MRVTLGDLPMPHRERALWYNEIKYPNTVNLVDSFVWRNTFEGEAFWNYVDGHLFDKGIDIPDLPPLHYEEFTPTYFVYAHIYEECMTVIGGEEWQGICKLYFGPGDRFTYFLRPVNKKFHFHEHVNEYWKEKVKSMRILTKI